MEVINNIAKSFQELVFRRKLESIDKRKTYNFSIGPNEKLPLEAWRYLVKRRAKFRCEDCSETISLDSHHIIPREYKGRNILRNGRCLCRECHLKYKKLSRNTSLVYKDFVKEYGYTKGTKIFEEYRACNTYKERGQILDRIKEEKLELVKRECAKLEKEFDDRMEEAKESKDYNKLLNWLNSKGIIKI